MVKNSVRFSLALSTPTLVVAPNTIDATFGVTTGVRYIGSDRLKAHALGMQSDQTIIARGVVTGMNDYLDQR